MVVVQFKKMNHWQYQRLASRPAGTRAFRQTVTALMGRKAGLFSFAT
jgi:hypothetical protein